MDQRGWMYKDLSGSFASPMYSTCESSLQTEVVIIPAAEFDGLQERVMELEAENERLKSLAMRENDSAIKWEEKFRSVERACISAQRLCTLARQASDKIKAELAETNARAEQAEKERDEARAALANVRQQRDKAESKLRSIVPEPVEDRREGERRKANGKMDMHDAVYYGERRKCRDRRKQPEAKQPEEWPFDQLSQEWGDAVQRRVEALERELAALKAGKGE